MTRHPRILLHEANRTLLPMMQYNFEREGFVVKAVTTADEALAAVEQEPFDLVVLNGTAIAEQMLELCQALRLRVPGVYLPVVIITPPQSEAVRIAAYAQGVDDLIVRPYSLPELLARIRAILRRTAPDSGGRVLRAGGIELDSDRGLVRRDGVDLALSSTEVSILRYLMEHAGKVRSREQIRNAVWGRDSAVDLRAVDVRMTRLRRRLNGEGWPDAIRTIRSVGYALSV